MSVHAADLQGMPDELFDILDPDDTGAIDAADFKALVPLSSYSSLFAHFSSMVP